MRFYNKIQICSDLLTLAKYDSFNFDLSTLKRLLYYIFKYIFVQCLTLSNIVKVWIPFWKLSCSFSELFMILNQCGLKLSEQYN